MECSSVCVRSALYTFKWDAQMSVTMFADFSPNQRIIKHEMRPVGHQRKYASFARLGRKVYITGGRDESLVPSDSAFEYDLNTGSTKQLGNFHNARTDHSSFGLDRKVYVFGGLDPNWTYLGDRQWLRIAAPIRYSLEILDTVKSSFTTLCWSQHDLDIPGKAFPIVCSFKFSEFMILGG